MVKKDLNLEGFLDFLHTDRYIIIMILRISDLNELLSLNFYISPLSHFEEYSSIINKHFMPNKSIDGLQ